MKKIYKIMKLLSVVFILGISLQFSKAQLVVVDTVTDYTQLVDDFILSGVTVSNIEHINASLAIGSFSNGYSTNIGVDNGIILSTGNINDVSGPVTNFASTNNDTTGDSDLGSLIPGYTTNDAAILEFDLIPDGNVLVFNYVFGSEEYPEWVSTSFNDVFALFISGPGIAGKQNTAVIPGTTWPVTIDNVNNVIPSYSQYYIDNEALGGTTITYDGFTTVLEAQADVIPGETYHLKIAIADAGDNSYDSGVFLQCPSLKSYTITKTEENDINDEITIFPNPVNPNSYIQCTLKEEKNVCIEVYNILGKKLNTLINSKQNQGTYRYTLNTFCPKNKGMFILKVNIGDKTITKKLIVN